MAEWAVLYVRTGEEARIAQKCDVQDLGTSFVPMEHYVRAQHGQRQETLRPYLPGYVFLQWEPEPKRYYLVRDIPGVIRFLGDGSPDAVPEAEMQVMFALDRQGASPPAPITLSNGRTVIAGGAMAGVPHKVLRINRRAGRATLEVQLLGEKHTVRITVEKHPNVGDE